MLTLAIEQSCATGSVALRDVEGRVTERTWTESKPRSHSLFPNLRALFREAGIGPDAVDRFAVGIGPGSFTGIRMALSCAWGMALPSGLPVAGFPSPDILATDLARETAAARLTIVGDARRERLWLADYSLASGHATRLEPPRVVPVDKLSEHLQPGMLVATPDWTRLSELLNRLTPGSCALLREARTPRARTLAELASAESVPAAPEFPLPIYLHSAV